jgi:hypothetical protein
MTVILIALGGLVTVTGAMGLMARLDGKARREFERRRREWYADGCQGPSPGEDLRGGGGAG